MTRAFALYVDRVEPDRERRRRRATAVAIVLLHVFAIGWLLRQPPLTVDVPTSLVVVELNALASAAKSVDPRHRAEPAPQHAATRRGTPAAHASSEVRRRADVDRIAVDEGRLAHGAGAQPYASSPDATGDAGRLTGSAGDAGAGHAGHFRPPRVLHRFNPDYPLAAFDAHVEGGVDVIVTIDANGALLDAHVDRSSGNADLDAAAVAAVRRYTFMAGEKDGQPLQAQAIIEIEWRITPGTRREITYTLHSEDRQRAAETKVGSLQFLGGMPPDMPDRSGGQ